jgi:hypothetical protein
MWNAVEDRIQTGTKYGRIVRKLVFEQIYADRNAVLSQVPIPMNTMPLMKVILLLNIRYK